MRAQNAFTLFAFALVLTACGTFATEPAQTFNQKFAYAVGTHTAVLQATTSAVSAGTLSSNDATTILAQADQARIVLDAAQAANTAGDAAGANAQLAIAVVSLTALQDYLRAHAKQVSP